MWIQSHMVGVKDISMTQLRQLVTSFSQQRPRFNSTYPCGIYGSHHITEACIFPTTSVFPHPKSYSISTPTYWTTVNTSGKDILPHKYVQAHKKIIQKTMHIMTHYTQQSPAEEADCLSVCQEVPSLLLNPRVNDSVSRNPQVGSP